MFEDRKKKEEEGGVAVESYDRDTPIHAATREDTNDLLEYGYETDGDILT